MSDPKFFCVTQPTSEVIRDGDRWEIYNPEGSGGIVSTQDIKDWVVAELLDAIANGEVVLVPGELAQALAAPLPSETGWVLFHTSGMVEAAKKLRQYIHPPKG